MINKQLQTVYVAVSVDERLPEGEGYVFTIVNGRHTNHDYKPFDTGTTHWLSPQQGILLSVDEWEGMKKCVEFQSRVREWLLACFGEEISNDRTERNHRFLEESLELVQSLGCTKSEAHQLVDYVFDRPEGEPYQETGGVMVTLSALCSANNLDMQNCGEKELARIWTKVEKIRAKQAEKPKHSPLP